MRALTLTAYEFELGQQVMSMGQKEFIAPYPVVTGIKWVRDNPCVTLAMQMGEVTMHLDPDLLCDVVHPEQDPIYEVEDFDPYDYLDMSCD